jgi:hypothetical protein
MSDNRHRLRKYKRRKDRASGAKWDRLAALYWRYWFKVYGEHRCIWEQE